MNLMKRSNAPEAQKERIEVTPAARIAENNDAFTLTVEVPGVDEKGIELSLEERTLSITAENTVENFKGYTLALTEIPEIRYRAAYELPERVDTAGIKAAHRNGLLILTLPKREEVKPRRIAITAA
jgi:HSP20 family molecular chaperone IbpA